LDGKLKFDITRFNQANFDLKKDGIAAQRAWVWANFTCGNQCLFTVRLRVLPALWGSETICKSPVRWRCGALHRQGMSRAGWAVA
jgi:hypothetical protein